MSDFSQLSQKIAANVAAVRERIAGAVERCGRSINDVTLVAVSKYAGCEDGLIDALLAAGCHDLGESRPQALLEKAARFKNVRWHMIGSLQRNKIRKLLSITYLLHSIDSLRLAEAIDRIAEEENLSGIQGLLEINISGDSTKHGFLPQELEAAMETLGRLERLHIDGLMCMAGLESTPEETRVEFRAVATLAKTLAPNCPPNVRLHELSMGMSDDFEIAIEEGATFVRVGSLLFQ